jgi:phage terminase small subunit
MAVKEFVEKEDKDIFKSLNPNQQNFVLNYIETKNAVKSYLAAYPKSNYKTAGVQAHRALKNPNISRFLNNYYEELWSSRKREIGRTFDNLLKIANADIANIVSYEGDRMEVRPFSQSDTFIIAEIKETVSETQNGTNVNRSVKLKDSTKATSELVKVLGMITEKVEMSGTIEIIKAVRPDSLKKIEI